MSKKILSLVAAALSALSLAAAGPIQKTAESPAARHWADSVYKTLSERERVGQLFCPKVVPTRGAQSKAAIKTFVDTYGAGGLLFTEGTTAQYAEMANYAQQIAKVPLLMTLDGEWGLAMRIKDAPVFPHNMAIGAIADPKYIQAYGAEVGRECRQMGINVNFAPVADVNSNPANPVIGYRAFGSDPERVAVATDAYSKGLEGAGVQAVAKHFPGHGDTAGDSHKVSVTVDRSLPQLDAVELVPFRQFVKDGGSAIMMGHIAVPAIDPTGTPASLSAKAYQFLRKDLGFKGLIYTDALGMQGAKTRGKTNVCVAAINAGADVLLAENTATDIAAVMKAIKKGKISKKTIEERCKRVLAYKYALTHGVKPMVTDMATLPGRLDTDRTRALEANLADRIITVLSNEGNVLPMDTEDGRGIAVVNLGAPAENEFTAMCRRYADVDAYGGKTPALTSAQLKAIRRHGHVIIAVYNDNASTRTAFNTLKEIPGAVAVFMINAYQAGKFAPLPQTLGAVVMAYDNLPTLRRSAAKAVFGAVATTGTMPVDVKGLGSVGQGVRLKKTRLGYATPLQHNMRASLTDTIDSICNDLVARGGMPGAQVLVAKGGDIIHYGNYGQLTKGGLDVNDSTMYDLASVSKVLGTLPGVMLAYDRGLIDLDAPVSRYIPGMDRPDKRDITVRQLLYHESGMAPSLNMFTTMIDTATYTGQLITNKPDDIHTIKIQNGAYGHKDGKLRRDITSPVRTPQFDIEAARGLWVGQATIDTIFNRIYANPLNESKEYRYSCLNFCLLMDMEQHVTGRNHRDWVRDNIWRPMGMHGVCYRPAEGGRSVFNVAPTENDTYMRRQTLQGFVHDELNAFSGGIQGNAGLFGNAHDLAKLCQMWLNGGVYGNRRIFSEATVDLFMTDKSATCHRGLGFDKPWIDKPDWSSTTSVADPSVVGHTGFTGTCFWIDPKNDMFYIFLTNRVNPTRDSVIFNGSYIRPKIFRAMYEALQNAE